MPRVQVSEYPFEARVLRVSQPIGTFYITALPARLLLDVAYSDAMQAVAQTDGSGYIVEGTQRLPNPKRLPQIAGYIDRVDAAFPNSLILAANFRQDTGFLEDDDQEQESEPFKRRRWDVVQSGGELILVIPTGEKLAAIIDGQHRLFAFADVQNPARLDMQLVCAVFLELTKPYQAQLFATINSTQKPVDKSLTYELFGYNISDDTEDHWTPDKLAVLLTRKLGTDARSPLCGRIIVSPRRDSALSNLSQGVDWKVSTAAVAEGIMRLFTSDPKRDSDFLLSPTPKVRSALRNERRDRSPFRELYLTGNDSLIFTAVMNFLNVCNEIFWTGVKPNSFITRTVGIQALFDVLRDLAPVAYSSHDVSLVFFSRWLERAAGIDFAGETFRKASGSGRVVIRQALREALDIAK